MSSNTRLLAANTLSISVISMVVSVFTPFFLVSTHLPACQGTATPTACWESWWARARGRWRRRRSGSSASGRGRRSWRNAPAPRRCCPPGASRWPRSSRRLWTRCGTSTLCCEYSGYLWGPHIGETRFTFSHRDLRSGRSGTESRCLLDKLTDDFLFLPVWQWNRWRLQWPLASGHMVR